MAELEDRVEFLEKSMAQMTQGLRMLAEGQDRMISTLQSIESTLHAHTLILTDHVTLLGSVVSTLQAHSGRLDSVVATLQDHSSRLAMIESYLSNRG